MTVCMLVIPLTACNNKDEWITDESWIEVTGSDEVQSSGTKDDKTLQAKTIQPPARITPAAAVPPARKTTIIEDRRIQRPMLQKQ